MSQYAKYLAQFFLLLLFQVLILNNVALFWWSQPKGFPVFTPYIYPLFILLLPFEAPVWLLLIIGFVCGGIVDAFMNTPGMHAFAMVLIAYLRTNVLLAPPTQKHEGIQPAIALSKNNGLAAIPYVQQLFNPHSSLRFLHHRTMELK